MKLFTYTLILLYFYIFSSCKGDSSNSAPFDGVFVTESGIKFELKEDSTTLILFDDTLNYEGVWSIHHTNESEYANIEFAGKPDYYYLKDKKIYRSKREMESDWMGTISQLIFITLMLLRNFILYHKYRRAVFN